jgi:hypothetical protein
MSVLFHLRRGRAVLGATAVLLTLVLASTAGAVPAGPDATAGAAAPALVASKAQEAYYASYGDAQPIQSASATSDSTSRPSWLGFALAAGGALLLGGVAGAAGGTVVVRRTRPVGLIG